MDFFDRISKNVDPMKRLMKKVMKDTTIQKKKR